MVIKEDNTYKIVPTIVLVKYHDYIFIIDLLNTNSPGVQGLIYKKDHI